jgi:hypothetical protein
MARRAGAKKMEPKAMALLLKVAAAYVAAAAVLYCKLSQ